GELHQFLSLLGTKAAPKWDYFRRAKEAMIDSWAYRGLYAELSCYAHAGFEMSRPTERKKPWRWANFVALLAPIDTAMPLHGVSCADEPCPVGNRYKALLDEINRLIFGQPNPGIADGVPE